MSQPAPSPAGFPAWRNPVVLIGAALSLAAAVATVRYVEQRFDGADARNAVELVQAYRAPSGRRLQDAIRSRHPGVARSALRWESETLSSCQQHVRVRALVADRSGRTTDYSFDVDINTVSIHPGNPNGMAVLRNL